MRDELSSGGQKAGVKIFTEKWRSMAESEKSKYYKLAEKLKGEYIKRNKSAFAIAVKNKDWSALKDSELQIYGTYDEIKRHELFWKAVKFTYYEYHTTGKVLEPNRVYHILYSQKWYKTQLTTLEIGLKEVAENKISHVKIKF